MGKAKYFKISTPTDKDQVVVVIKVNGKIITQQIVDRGKEIKIPTMPSDSIDYKYSGWLCNGIIINKPVKADTDLTFEPIVTETGIKEEYRNQIDSYHNLTREQKNLLVAEINAARTKEDLDNVITKAKSYTGDNSEFEKALAEAKSNAESSINSMNELTKEEKDKYLNDIKNTHVIPNVKLIESEARNINTSRSLYKDKENAVNDITNQKNKEISDLTTKHNEDIRNLNAEHQQEITDLNEKHKKEVDTLNVNHAKAEAGIKESYENKIKGIKESNQAEINKLKAEQEQAIADLNTQHEADIASLKTQHQTEIDNLNKLHDKVIADLKAQHQAELDELTTTKDKEIADTIAEYEEKLKTAKDNYDATIVQIKKTNQDTINKLNTQHEQEVNDLNTKHEQDIANLNTQHAKDKAAAEKKYNDNIKELNAKHAKELADKEALAESEKQELINKHATEIDNLSAKHTQAINDLKEAHKATIASIEATNTAKIEELNTQHQAEIDSLNKQHEKEIADLKAKHAEAIKNLGGSSEAAIEELNKQHAEEIANLKVKHTKEISDLEAKHQAELDKKDSDHQAAIDNLNTLHNKELESLKLSHANEINKIKLENAKDKLRDQLIDAAYIENKATYQTKIDNLTSEDKADVLSTQIKNQNIADYKKNNVDTSFITTNFPEYAKTINTNLDKCDNIKDLTDKNNEVKDLTNKLKTVFDNINNLQSNQPIKDAYITELKSILATEPFDKTKIYDLNSKVTKLGNYINAFYNIIDENSKLDEANRKKYKDKIAGLNSVEDIINTLKEIGINLETKSLDENKAVIKQNISEMKFISTEEKDKINKSIDDAKLKSELDLILLNASKDNDINCIKHLYIENINGMDKLKSKETYTTQINQTQDMTELDNIFDKAREEQELNSLKDIISIINSEFSNILTNYSYNHNYNLNISETSYPFLSVFALLGKANTKEEIENVIYDLDIQLRYSLFQFLNSEAKYRVSKILNEYVSTLDFEFIKATLEETAEDMLKQPYKNITNDLNKYWENIVNWVCKSEANRYKSNMERFFKNNNIDISIVEDKTKTQVDRESTYINIATKIKNYYEKLISQKEAQHTTEIELLKAQHTKDLKAKDDIITSKDKEIADNKESYLEKEKKLNADHQTEIDKLNSQHEANINTLNTKHESEIATLKEENQTKITELNNKHQIEITNLDKTHSEELATKEAAALEQGKQIVFKEFYHTALDYDSIYDKVFDSKYKTNELKRGIKILVNDEKDKVSKVAKETLALELDKINIDNTNITYATTIQDDIIEAFKRVNSYYNLKLDTEISNAETKLNNLKTQHQAEIKNLNTQHAQEISTLKTNHQAEIDSLTSKNNKAIADLKEQHTHEIAELNAKHQAEVDNLNSTHTAAINKLKQEHATEIDNLTKTNKSKVDDLTSKLSTALSDGKHMAIEEINKLEFITTETRDASIDKIKGSNTLSEVKAELEAQRVNDKNRKDALLVSNDSPYTKIDSREDLLNNEKEQYKKQIRLSDNTTEIDDVLSNSLLVSQLRNKYTSGIDKLSALNKDQKDAFRYQIYNAKTDEEMISIKTYWENINNVSIKKSEIKVLIDNMNTINKEKERLQGKLILTSDVNELTKLENEVKSLDNMFGYALHKGYITKDNYIINKLSQYSGIAYLFNNGHMVMTPEEKKLGYNYNPNTVDMDEVSAVFSAMPTPTNFTGSFNDNIPNEVKPQVKSLSFEGVIYTHIIDFSKYTNLKSIDFLHYVYRASNGGIITNRSEGNNNYTDCKSLQNIDYTNLTVWGNIDGSLNTEKTNNFTNCNTITSINFANKLDNNQRTFIFNSCYNLKIIDGLNNITKINFVSNMNEIFYYCDSLTTNVLQSLVNKFNTENVTSMRSAFGNCKLVTRLDLTNFNTSKVTDMYSMFDGCDSMEYIDLSSFDMSKVKNTSYLIDMPKLKVGYANTQADADKINNSSSYNAPVKFKPKSDMVEKERYINIIKNISLFTDTEKQSYETRINNTNTLAEAKAIYDEAMKEMKKRELDSTKTQYINMLDYLTDLSSQEKSSFTTRINNATTREDIISIYREANDKNTSNKELADAKTNAKNTIQGLSYLSQSRKDYWKGEVDKCTKAEEVRMQVLKANLENNQEKSRQELENYKNNGVSKVNARSRDVPKFYKDKFNTRIRQATSTSQVDDIVNEAIEMDRYYNYQYATSQGYIDLDRNYIVKNFEYNGIIIDYFNNNHAVVRSKSQATRDCNIGIGSLMASVKIDDCSISFEKNIIIAKSEYNYSGKKIRELDLNNLRVYSMEKLYYGLDINDISNQPSYASSLDDDYTKMFYQAIIRDTIDMTDVKFATNSPNNFNSMFEDASISKLLVRSYEDENYITRIRRDEMKYNDNVHIVVSGNGGVISND